MAELGKGLKGGGGLADGNAGELDLLGRRGQERLALEARLTGVRGAPIPPRSRQTSLSLRSFLASAAVGLSGRAYHPSRAARTAWAWVAMSLSPR